MIVHSSSANKNCTLDGFAHYFWRNKQSAIHITRLMIRLSTVYGQYTTPEANFSWFVFVSVFSVCDELEVDLQVVDGPARPGG